MMIAFHGRPIRWVEDRWVEGVALVERIPVSFLGYVNERGRIVEPESEHRGEEVSGKVLFFPSSRGSTVGSYVLVNLKKKGVAPSALVMVEPSLVVISGAVVADIPFIYGVEEGVLEAVKTGDFIKLNPLRGEVVVASKGVEGDGE